MNVADVKRLLGLEAHPVEGGSFRRTYESRERIATPHGERFASTAIYYLLEPGTFSEMHVLKVDELYHFYLGAPVEMLQLWPDGSTRVVKLGQNLEAGEHVQLLVPAGVWQGTRLLDEKPGSFALMGCTLTPGFDFEDYTSAGADELIVRWPGEAERIRKLTRS
jgi:predicted cupin superfamily sugar epimerase